MDIHEIMKILPHRYPFLMIDRITELVPGHKAVGIKNLSCNEPYFPGHFPGQPVMAQVGACAVLSEPQYKGYIAYLAGVDRVRFKRQAIPGDVLEITTELIAMKNNIGKGKGRITVNGDLVCQSEFLFALSAGQDNESC